MNTNLCGDFSDAPASQVLVQDPDVQGLDDLLGRAGLREAQPGGGHEQLDAVLLLLEERRTIPIIVPQSINVEEHASYVQPVDVDLSRSNTQRCCHSFPKPQKKTDVQPPHIHSEDLGTKVCISSAAGWTPPAPSPHTFNVNEY